MTIRGFDQDSITGGLKSIHLDDLFTQELINPDPLFSSTVLVTTKSFSVSDDISNLELFRRHVLKVWIISPRILDEFEKGLRTFDLRCSICLEPDHLWVNKSPKHFKISIEISIYECFNSISLCRQDFSFFVAKMRNVLLIKRGPYWDRTSDPHNVNVVLYR